MQVETITDVTTTGFPVLFTKEEFKSDVLELMVLFTHQAQFIFMSDAKRQSVPIWSLLSPALEGYSGSASSGTYASHMALKFSDIEQLCMAQALMELYDYGVQGIQDGKGMDSFDGYENQVSRLCYDMSRSEFLNEWDNGGLGLGLQTKAAERCLYVCELANARLMLEGAEEGFFLDDREVGFLSIRQMSLLSGMTEASIRTLVSRNRKSLQTSAGDSNSLLITKNDGKNTSIDIADAKAWLKSKGRYTPITKKMTQGAEDFTSHKFMSRDEFEKSIAKRLRFLESEYGKEIVDERVTYAGVVPVLEAIVPNIDWETDAIGEAQLLDKELMRRFAVALELPEEMFALRAAEAVMHDKLRTIEAQLKLTQQQK